MGIFFGENELKYLEFMGEYWCEFFVLFFFLIVVGMFKYFFDLSCLMLLFVVVLEFLIDVLNIFICIKVVLLRSNFFLELVLLYFLFLFSIFKFVWEDCESFMLLVDDF